MSAQTIHRVNAFLLGCYLGATAAAAPRISALWSILTARARPDDHTDLLQTVIREHPVAVWFAIPVALILTNVVISFFSDDQEPERRVGLAWIAVGLTIASAGISVELYSLGESIATRI